MEDIEAIPRQPVTTPKLRFVVRDCPVNTGDIVAEHVAAA